MVSDRARRASWSHAILVAALAALSLTAPEARAQTAAEKETARSLLDEGDKKRAAKDYDAALKAYKAADAIMGVPTTKIEVGKMQELMGRLAEARDTYLEVGRIAPKPKENAAFVKAREEAAAHAAALAARIPSIRVVWKGVPAGVDPELKVDGALIPPAAAAAPLKVNPGAHTIAAAAPGAAPVTKSVTVTEGENAEVAIDLTGALAVAPPGSPEPSKPGLSPLVFAGFGVGAAGLLIGSITGGLSLSKASQAKGMCTGTQCPSSAAPVIDSSIRLANVSNVSFAVGLAGAALGVVGVVISRKAPAPPAPPSALTLRPVVGAGYAGLQGEF